MKTFHKKILSYIALPLFLLSNFFIYNNLIALSNIDPNDKYAWGDLLGWVNFNPTNGNVTVSNSGLMGYIWSQNYGWINLSPSTGGVSNDGFGDLSGNAWGENIGWINFNNVSINNQGYFTGLATTETKGSINFDCSNCSVKTSWSSGYVSVNFVNAQGEEISSPSFKISNTNFDMSQKTITSYVGDSNKKIRITNTTQNPLWTVSISPSGGMGALWEDGNGHSYKFNGTNSEGNMTIDPSSLNITGTGLIRGNTQTFSLINNIGSVTIASSTGSSSNDTHFDLENLGISQVIPAGQIAGEYGINMTLTIIQN